MAARPSCALGGRVVCCGQSKGRRNKTCRTMSVDKKLRITDRGDRGRTMSTTWRHVFKRAGWQSRLLWTKQRKKKQNESNDVRGQEVENH
nr:hypothetical protein BgiMline_031837 [Biomphalaria glabrata]